MGKNSAVVCERFTVANDGRARRFLETAEYDKLPPIVRLNVLRAYFFGMCIEVRLRRNQTLSLLKTVVCGPISLTQDDFK